MNMPQSCRPTFHVITHNRISQWTYLPIVLYTWEPVSPTWIPDMIYFRSEQPKAASLSNFGKTKKTVENLIIFQLHNLLWLNYKPCLCSYWNKVTLRRLIESYSARATRFNSLDTKLIWLFWQLTCSQWLDSVSYAYRVQAVMWMLCVCEYTAACRTNIMK